MAKRSAFIVVAQNVPDMGATTPDGEFTNPERQLQIQPPAGLVVTRLTIQVQGINYTSAAYFEIVFSNVPIRSAQQGFKLQTQYDSTVLAILPASFTMENYQEEGIDSTLYIANTTPGSVVPICILYEGYYNK